MPGKRGADATDRDWLLAVWEWAAELGETDGPGVRVSMTPTTRAGVFTVTVAACEVVDGRIVQVVAKKAGEWPNADRVALGAYILRLMAALDAELAAEIMRGAEGGFTPA